MIISFKVIPGQLLGTFDLKFSVATRNRLKSDLALRDYIVSVTVAASERFVGQENTPYLREQIAQKVAEWLVKPPLSYRCRMHAECTPRTAEDHALYDVSFPEMGESCWKRTTWNIALTRAKRIRWRVTSDHKYSGGASRVTTNTLATFKLGRIISFAT